MLIKMSTFSLSISELISNVQNNHEELGNSYLNFPVSEASHPNSVSTLRTNRGVTYFLAGLTSDSIKDLEEAVEANHLNYVAYFNLFSIQVSNNKFQEGLKNLCCALSCLYLLRGRQRGAESDINKAINYCENNLEARLMKGMHYVEKKKYSLALNEINWTLDLQPNNEKFQEIKAGIQKKIIQQAVKKGSPPTISQPSQERSLDLEIAEFDEIPKRLRCSLYEEENMEGMNLIEEIRKKLLQYNQLYGELNSQQTAMIKKTPPVYVLGQITQNSGNADTSGKKNDQKDGIVSSLMIEQEEEDSENNGLASPNFKNQQGEENDGKIDDFFKQGHNQGKAPSEVEHRVDDASSHASAFMFNSENPSISKTGNSIIPESNISYTLHAMEDDKNLSIKIFKIELSQLSEEEREKMNHLYCQFEYGEKKFNTNDSMGEGFNSWESPFETELQDEPQVLTIAIFNKEIHAFKDKYVGSGAKQIVTTGRIEVPIYKDTQRVEAIGKVLLDIKYK